MHKDRTRAILLFVVVIAFTILILGGMGIAKHKPPIPGQVVDPDGAVVFTHDDILTGQKYYLARGGQHVGSVYGHGAYLAPDWTADALHRTALVAAGLAAGRTPADAGRMTQEELEALDVGERGRIEALVAKELHTNRYDAASDTLTLSPGQAAAFPALVSYYTTLFTEGNDAMSIRPGMVDSPENGRAMTAFFFWTAWTASTNRPDVDYSYTANWPFDPLAGNRPLPGAVTWSIVSVLLLILGMALAIFFYLRMGSDEEPVQLKPLPTPNPTPSQRATHKYFVVVALLFLVQAILGSITGHYAVEGNRFYGIDTSDVIPYAASRTWHVQLSVFWIATAWLATGLFLGPFVSRFEPKGQRLLVNVLFGAILVVVVGALGGTWASIAGKFGGDGFLFGHQGYEYIELGRIWQIGLIAGMLIWWALLLRALMPALKSEPDRGGLTHLLLYAAATIPLFYMVGLFYTSGTHIAVAEYWRWWVVHLWVENFFEVFATVAIAFLLSRIGAVRPKTALRIVYLSILLYLGAGIVGTFHHLYFSGTPLYIQALGATFSALEVVPLTLIGFEVIHNLGILKKGGKDYPYRWPIMFFLAVAFWNLIGAGVFGFLINPPIVLYYAQGLNTTPIHSHGALMGVYGFLAIALTLFSLRHTVSEDAWSDRLLKISFWGLNVGLALMMALSLIPAGFYQFAEALQHGTWYARSPAVTGSDFIHTATWLRVVPDIIFDIGIVAFVLFVIRAVFARAPKKAT